MKLSDKIVFCRIKSGISQDRLADLIGVPVKTLSEWESGEALPELRHLPPLARALHVTTDWLLSEDEPEPEPETDAAPPCSPYRDSSNAKEVKKSWVDSVPGTAGRLINKYGWLYGVYTAFGGLVLTIGGMLLRRLAGEKFFGSLYDIGGIMQAAEEAGYDVAGSYGSQGAGIDGIISTVGGIVAVAGVVMLIAGAALAVYLKKRKK